MYFYLKIVLKLLNKKSAKVHNGKKIWQCCNGDKLDLVTYILLSNFSVSCFLQKMVEYLMLVYNVFAYIGIET